MSKSLYKDIEKFLIGCHKTAPKGNPLKRLQQTASLILGCIRSRSCSLDQISQSCPKQSTNNKSSLLQNTKRWLKNKWTDYDSHFLPLALYFLDRISCKGELVFIIDGSQVGTSHTVLMVSVLWRNKSIPIVWMVKKGEKGHFPEKMHVDLLSTLASLCPTSCRVVLLGDGEFDGFYLRDLCKRNYWEFVLRTSCDRLIDCGGERAAISTLKPSSTGHARPGHAQVFVEDALDGINAVWWHNERYDSPIYLLTNMDVGQMACLYYKKRFEIECMFKQMKSKGFNIHKTQLKDAERIENLLIIASAAFIFVSGLGIYLQTTKQPKDLEHIVRKDKLPRMAFVTLAWACLKEDFDLALEFFSDMSKNFDAIFT